MLSLLANFATCTLYCQDYLKYDNKTHKCCAMSDAIEDIWLCPNNTVCVIGKKCAKYLADPTNYPAIVYTAWFCSFSLQALLILYLICKFRTPRFSRSHAYVILYQFLLHFGLFTFCLAVILSVKKNSLFGNLAALTLVFCGIWLFLSIRSILLSDDPDKDFFNFKNTFESKVNTFHGDKSLGKYWRSTVIDEVQIPRDILFNFKIIIKSNHKGFSAKNEDIDGKGYLKYSIFYSIRHFLIRTDAGFITLFILHGLGLAAPFIYFETILDRNCSNYTITILQEVTEEENDPLFPFKTSQKGDYRFEDFFNYSFGDDIKTNLEYKLNIKLLQYDDEDKKPKKYRSRQKSSDSEISLSNEDIDTI